MTTKKVGYVYAIENNFNNSVYIGLTTKTIKERYAQHLQAAKSNELIEEMKVINDAKRDV